MIRASFGHVKGHLKGFTLIELLVVIAIIGILSSVVLASLSTARSRSADAKIQSQLSSIRAAAEIYYTSSGNYGADADTCSEGMYTNTTSGLANLVSSNSYPSGTTVGCFASSTGWAVQATLQNGGQFCVDYSGRAATTTGSTVSASDFTCNP